MKTWAGIEEEAPSILGEVVDSAGNPYRGIFQVILEPVAHDRVPDPSPDVTRAFFGGDDSRFTVWPEPGEYTLRVRAPGRKSAAPVRVRVDGGTGAVRRTLVVAAVA